MNIYTDYSQKCPDCHKCFYSATSLLVHFFSHVGEEKLVETGNNENSSTSKKKPIETSNYGSSKPLNLTVGETLNPWKYCLATYEENNDNPVKSFKKVTKKNKEKDKNFECSLCSKKFGWTTDLKRHLLIHTGERPFKCNSCQAAFTRNFLLQKHFARAHKKVSEDESKKLENHVHANVTEIKLKMKELECQREHSKSVSDNDS
ncbi:zinc finger protein 92-like [Rhopalosiphum padi]|uniref:zinc finger protein 92-like n=1 Tax=Rhopalosiphum padi TaxID=40932 RepID=UPI00298DBF7E|nr:zinc finger protein 92-like [Rhopalosiphum padi]